MAYGLTDLRCAGCGSQDWQLDGATQDPIRKTWTVGPGEHQFRCGACGSASFVGPDERPKIAASLKPPKWP